MNESEIIMYYFCEGLSIERIAFISGIPRNEVEDVLIKSCLNGKLSEFYEPEELVA